MKYLLILLLILAFPLATASSNSITGCQEINKSGSYYLVTDIHCDLVHEPCFEISAKNVYFYGQGHSINPGEMDCFVVFDVRDSTKVVIRNLTILYGASEGFDVYNVSNLEISDVNIDVDYLAMDIYNVSSLELDDLDIRTDYVGMDLYNVTKSHINKIRLNIDGSTGINAVYSNIVLENSNITGNEIEAINLAESSGTIRGNRITSVDNAFSFYQNDKNLLIYNNYIDAFYETVWFNPFGNFSNIQWNIPKQSGRNIIGGSYLGGNYWVDGVSPFCSDNNADGLCDYVYQFVGRGFADYLPLTNHGPGPRPIIPIKSTVK